MDYGFLFLVGTPWNPFKDPWWLSQKNIFSECGRFMMRQQKGKENKFLVGGGLLYIMI